MMRSMAKLGRMKIALYKSEKFKHAEIEEVTWQELVELLSTPRESATKYGPAWSPVELSFPERCNENVVAITAAVLDLDNITTEQLNECKRILTDYKWIIHSTFSDKEDSRCLRLVLELNRAVNANDWRRVLRRIVETYRIPADPACKDVARLYFLPARPAGSNYYFETNEGVSLDVDEILMLGGGSQLGCPLDSTQPGSLSLQAMQAGEGKPPDCEVLASAVAFLKQHGPAVEGQNGDKHTYIASAALTHDFALPPETAWELLKAWNQSCKPPWTEAELLQKALNASQYATEPYGSKRPVIDGVEAYGANLQDFLGTTEPEQEETWLLPGIIAAGVPQVIAGPPKSMKSYLAEHIALCLASGRAWVHGDFTPARRNRVLLLPKEDSPNETKRRLWWLMRGMGLASADIDGYLYVDAESPFRFDDESDVRRMQATIETQKPDLVIIDSLTEVHRQDENSAAGMKQVIDNWAMLCRRNKVAIACIHHFRKPTDFNGRVFSAGSRLRGSSAIHARVRHIVGVEPRGVEKGVSTLRIEGNLSGLPDGFSVRLVESVSSDGKPCYRLSFGGWE